MSSGYGSTWDAKQERIAERKLNRLQLREQAGLEGSVTDVALSVHSMVCGSSECDSKLLNRNVALLEVILDTWEPTVGRNSTLGAMQVMFDESVRKMLYAALAEGKEYLYEHFYKYFPVEKFKKFPGGENL